MADRNGTFSSSGPSPVGEFDLHKKFVEKECLHSWFFNLSFFMGHNCLWRSHAYSLGSSSTGAGRFAERAPEMIDSPPQP
jgi:hypothetical protein